MFNKSEKRPPFAKPSHVFPDMETIIPNKDYAITINTKNVPKTCDSSNYYAIVQMWLSGIQEHLNKEKNITYSLNLELSPTGRPHLHGTIQIKDPLVFTMFNVAKLMELGTVVIKSIVDDEWSTYINKQSVLPHYQLNGMKIWCTKHKIPYPLTNKSVIVHPLKNTNNELQFVEDYSDIE